MIEIVVAAFICSAVQAAEAAKVAAKKRAPRQIAVPAAPKPAIKRPWPPPPPSYP